MKLTVSQAARAAGKSKSQISRMVKSGRISADKSADGRPLIDLSELRRVYPDADPAQQEEHSPARNKKNRGNTGESSALRAQIDLIREDRDRLRVDLDAERHERRENEDHARQERDRLMGLLEASQRLIEDQTQRRKPNRPPSRLFGRLTVTTGVLLAVILVILLSGPALSQETYMVFGTGTISCGAWTKDRTDASVKSWQAEQWVSGYITAYNFWVEDEGGPVNRLPADGYGPIAWIDNYCQENPLEAVATAAAQMIYAIRDNAAP